MQNIKICEAKFDRIKERNRQIHLEISHSLSVTEKTVSQKIQ